MEHHFNVEFATEIGMAPAVILNTLHFWVCENECNNRNCHDGRYWTYNSVKAYCKYFPYLTYKQISGALKKLESQGYIVTGNYNKSAYDRTLWYALTEKGYSIFQNCKMDDTNLENGFEKNGKPIPDNKTNNKTTDRVSSLRKKGASALSEESEDYSKIF